ncbi:hypothetical protein EfmAA96_31650 (plasmid) [Enterococcus faecium]|nr:hypothetical protein EfmAA96_31650 [Enterococcus faecium]
MALQRLTRTRYQLIKQLIRTKQHFLENLTYKHKRALVLTARKFTRLVDTLLRKHQLYTPPRNVIEK